MSIVERSTNVRHCGQSRSVRHWLRRAWLHVAVVYLLVTISASLSGRGVIAAPIERPVVRQLALSGEVPVGYPAAGAFTHFSGPPVIDNRGNVAFLAGVGSGVSQPSLWMATESELRLVALSGNSAPNAAAEFMAFSDLTSAQDGVLAFKAALGGSATTADNRDSIWLYQSGSLHLVARTGWEAPDPAADLRFSGFETPVTVSSAGQVAYFARTRDKENASAQSSGLWVAQPNGVALAANAGGEAISGQPSIVFSPQSFEAPFAEDPTISPAGQTVFRGFLAGPGVDETNLNGLWSYGRDSGLQLWLRAGDAVDGPGGPTFLSFPGVPTINAAGDSAFLAFVGTPKSPSSLGLRRRETPRR